MTDVTALQDRRGSRPGRRVAALAGRLRASGAGATTRSGGCTRCSSGPPVRGRAGARADVDDLATQAADDALMAVLAKLDDFRGASRFATWAYKFALYEAPAKMRRRAWQGREVVPAPEDWPSRRRGPTPAADAETTELLEGLRDAIAASSPCTSATCCSRSPSTACRSTSSPSGSGTTRGALYKTLHDARRKPAALPREPRTMSDDHPRLRPREPELSCEECFERLDEYVEHELRSADAEARAPGCPPTSRAARPAARTSRACRNSPAVRIVALERVRRWRARGPRGRTPPRKTGRGGTRTRSRRASSPARVEDVPVTAMPAAAPMRWAVCSTPPALPARCDRDLYSVRVWFGEITSPPPRPATSSGSAV